MKNIFSTPEYGTGIFWIFNNGQFGEKKEINHRDHYQILYSDKDGSELGLHHWKSNDTGNNHFGGGLYSIAGLKGKLKEIYENLKQAIQCSN